MTENVLSGELRLIRSRELLELTSKKSRSNRKGSKRDFDCDLCIISQMCVEGASSSVQRQLTPNNTDYPVVDQLSGLNSSNKINLIINKC